MPEKILCQVGAVLKSIFGPGTRSQVTDHGLEHMAQQLSALLPLTAMSLQVFSSVATYCNSTHKKKV